MPVGLPYVSCGVCDLGDIQHTGTQICEISDTFSALSYVAKLPTSQLSFGLSCGSKNVQSLLAMTRWCEPVAENRPLFETRVQNYFKHSYCKRVCCFCTVSPLDYEF